MQIHALRLLNLTCLYLRANEYQHPRTKHVSCGCWISPNRFSTLEPQMRLCGLLGSHKRLPAPMHKCTATSSHLRLSASTSQGAFYNYACKQPYTLTDTHTKNSVRTACVGRALSTRKGGQGYFPAAQSEFQCIALQQPCTLTCSHSHSGSQPTCLSRTAGSTICERVLAIHTLCLHAIARSLK